MTAMKHRKPEPAVIEYKNMRFLITDRPTDSTLDRFIEELKRVNANEVVRVCEPTYKIDNLKSEGIDVLDWAFDDGSPPPNEIIANWIKLLKKRFRDDPGSCVAIHCVAGLGRAPVLVALALMEGGMKYEDAVDLIRQKRKGALNAKQLNFLQNYHAKSRLKEKKVVKCSIQ